MPRKRGRPARIIGETASARIWAWVTPRERAELQDLADNSHAPIASIVREAVNVFVAESSERRKIFRHG